MDQSEKSVRFGGIERLYGVHDAQAIARAHVCVIGLGGVGSWVVEALARTGVGKLTLVDLDEVCASNVNRQLHALTSTVGRSKAEVLRERAQQINPQLEVTAIEDFFTATTAEMILEPSYDVVIDCIDQFKNKVVMLDACRRRKLKLVVVGGAGGRRDPTRIKVADMSRSEGDVMLAMLRKRLRQKHGFPRKGTWGVKCVYSDEVPVMAEACEVAEGPTAEDRNTEDRNTEDRNTENRNTADRTTDDRTTDHRDPSSETRDPTPARKSVRLDCATGYGAATFVTGTFGFFASAAAIDVVLRKTRT